MSTQYKPELMVLCDYSLFSQDGKFSIIGIFDRIYVTQLPSTHAKMVIASVISGPPNTECEYVVEFIDPDGKLTKNKPVSMKVRIGQNGIGNVASEYIAFGIEQVGEFKVRLRINGDIVKDVPLYVQKVMTNEHFGNKPN